MLWISGIEIYFWSFSEAVPWTWWTGSLCNSNEFQEQYFLKIQLVPEHYCILFKLFYFLFCPFEAIKLLVTQKSEHQTTFKIWVFLWSCTGYVVLPLELTCNTQRSLLRNEQTSISWLSAVHICCVCKIYLKGLLLKKKKSFRTMIRLLAIEH